VKEDVIMEAIRSASTVPLSKDVRDFMKAAEGLLSHELRTAELTPEECEIIGEYIVTLSQAKHPWSKAPR
jgi:hypothetical protein